MTRFGAELPFQTKAMVHPVLEKDLSVPFPHVTVLKASAGSGKTYSLTERFVQFLLSDKIHPNHLRNILAITFSNNAAKEMRERILLWLKNLYFRDPKKTEEIAEIVSLKKEDIAEKAGATIDGILKNYTEFQVKTIDSFMTSIYKASAVDLGYSLDFDIVLDPRKIMAYAFDRFLRGVREKTPEAEFLEKLLEVIVENKGGGSAYPWDPSQVLLEEIVELHNKLSGIVKEAKIVEAEGKIESIKNEIRETAESLNGFIETSGLTKSKGSSFYKILEMVRGNAFPDLIDKGLSSVPVIKPKKKAEMTRYEKISEQWDLLGDHIKKYIELYAATYYGPYLRTYEAFKDILEEVKKREGAIFIHDVNKKLSDYLNDEIVPDVYFRIGETIYHYLIDEFQDTSPIQWANLFPLIENSLSQGGSLLAVGDTKQAIYGFRNADYGIMKGLESSSPFSSALHHVKELEVNYRSLETVIDFSKTFFRKVIALDDQYREPASRSGLIDYEQRVDESRRSSGYVEVIRCEKKEGEPPEREKIQDLIQALNERGYSWSDITILAYRNEDVVNITTWLNEVDVPFISYSSLDIRARKLTAEIVALLTFLDAPPDDLSFAGFILGDLFRKTLERSEKISELKTVHEFLFRNRKKSPLYKAFREEFPHLWEMYFEALFKSTGYLPLYDLVSEAYRIYRVFDHFGEEEATLIKILEVIKSFEGEGRNNPGEFLKYASDEEAGESGWTVDVPAGINAVRVMTLHKAKGLGFPVAIILLYEEVPRGFKYIFDEETDGVRLLKINQQIMKASSFLQKRYEEERLKDLVNKLNTLYVGFTRAEDELYIVGVQGKRDQFPIDLLKGMDSQTGRKGVPRLRSPETAQERMVLYHPLDPIEFPFEAAEVLNIEERRRGEFIHRVLYYVDGLGDIGSELERIIKRVNDELMTDYPVEAMKRNLLEFLHHEEINSYFHATPSRVVRKEQDFSDLRGNLFRMDRVIFEEDRIFVIDYKTGTDQEAEKEYILQLKNYIRILREIYPDKHVEGVIAYVDLKEITRVK
ncbi:MAG TPA: UvrD-helicase domain-containing protein [Thermodesulfobacteriota bacterium]|nr:UvrD-helicase domain-containing protein [Thermodesulfobacteriota bacterium]